MRRFQSPVRPSIAASGAPPGAAMGAPPLAASPLSPAPSRFKVPNEHGDPTPSLKHANTLLHTRHGIQHSSLLPPSLTHGRACSKRRPLQPWHCRCAVHAGRIAKLGRMGMTAPPPSSPISSSAACSRGLLGANLRAGCGPSFVGDWPAHRQPHPADASFIVHVTTSILRSRPLVRLFIVGKSRRNWH